MIATALIVTAFFFTFNVTWDKIYFKRYNWVNNLLLSLLSTLIMFYIFDLAYTYWYV
jgi:hypothetical protein